jgi:hypothetical protein
VAEKTKCQKMNVNDECEFKQRVIVGDDDPTIFVLANKQQEKDDGHCCVGERG